MSDMAEPERTDRMLLLRIRRCVFESRIKKDLTGNREDTGI